MEATELRILALTGLFALGNACIITLFVIWRAGVPSLRLTHIPLLLVTLGFLTLTALLLAISGRDHALVSRADIAPLIAVAEWGACVAGWAWYIYAAKASFCIVPRGGVQC